MSARLIRHGKEFWQQAGHDHVSFALLQRAMNVYSAFIGIGAHSHKMGMTGQLRLFDSKVDPVPGPNNRREGQPRGTANLGQTITAQSGH